MALLAEQRCFNHSGREAVARCTGCRGFFCRECVAEHDDRILCARCLKRSLAPPVPPRRRTFTAVVRALELGIGILILWFSFYALGKFLLSIPHQFHEGALWTPTEK